jgi:hypothetical protein
MERRLPKSSAAKDVRLRSLSDERQRVPEPDLERDSAVAEPSSSVERV